MSKANMGFFDWIDGAFRLAIGFFCGMALGHTAKLAELTSWWFAAGTLAVLSVFGFVMFKLVWAVDGGVQRLFDRATGVKYPGGIKPAKNPAPEPKRHWFIRFGWIPALVIGACAAYFLPEEALAWLP